MKNRLSNYVKSGHSGIFIVSHEEARIELLVKDVASDLKFALLGWSVTTGLIDYNEGSAIGDTEDPIAMLSAVEKIERAIVVLRDMHMFFAEPNPMLVRKFKDVLMVAKRCNVTMVIVGCTLKLQPELEKEFVVIEFALPTASELRVTLDGIVKSAEVACNIDHADAAVAAASGLTTTEAENAFALSIAEKGKIDPEVIAREKVGMINKGGILEVVPRCCDLSDIGGLALLKADLLEKRNLFTKEAREYGIDTPRGILVVGQPGTGKSLTAKATASVFEIPLLRLEAGKLFGSLVGESERNWRTAFATAKAIAPCILWIDEVDGLFSGGESSGRTDGGTTQRVLKAILQDMQMNADGIFFCFTANDVDNLPDPLIDRLNVWSVDLPTATERAQIWSIQIKKRKRDPKKLPVADLVGMTDGFSGRQIEQVWLKALTIAFNRGAEPKADDVWTAAESFVPTSVTMAEAIEKRRRRLKNRAQPASEPEPEKTAGRKMIKA